LTLKIGFLLTICTILLSKMQGQGMVSADPDTASIPCPNCPGASWSLTMNPMPITQYPFSLPCIVLTPDSFTQTLFLYDYDLAIPPNALVTGCELVLIRTSGGGSFIEDSLLFLTHLGQTVGNNKAIPGNWSQATDTITYGGPQDTWGYNLTAAMVNNREIGVAISVKAINYTLTLQQARMRIYYQMPMALDQSQSADLSLFPNPASSILYVAFDTKKTEEHYIIITQEGKKVEEGTLSSEKPILYISHFPDGAYFLVTDNQPPRKFKVQKQP
jgi:hypothetical protein